MTTLTFKPAAQSTIPVSETIQRSLEKVGSLDGNPLKFSEIHFTAGKYLINSRMYLNDDTTLSCDPGVTWELAPNLNFGLQQPILGQKNKTISGLNVSGINLYGNFTNQNTTPNDHGEGYGNFIGLTNVSNSKFSGMSGGFNEGDFFRLSNGKNLEFAGNAGEMGGHDWLHLYNCDNVKVHDNDVIMRANNVLRTRSCRNIDIFLNKCHGTRIAYAPPMQFENIEAGLSSFGIAVHDNFIENSYGPGMWLVGTVRNTYGINIYNNTINQCGQMPAASRISGVGGIIADGWDRVTIENNVIKGSFGYGVGFAKYRSVSPLSGYKAVVRFNTITGTRKPAYPGPGAGAGIANLLGAKYQITATGNKLAGNVLDYYKVVGR